jgi:hypothetical protein
VNVRKSLQQDTKLRYCEKYVGEQTKPKQKTKQNKENNNKRKENKTNTKFKKIENKNKTTEEI